MLDSPYKLLQLYRRGRAVRGVVVSKRSEPGIHTVYRFQDEAGRDYTLTMTWRGPMERLVN
jgi:hypothetical protein